MISALCSVMLQCHLTPITKRTMPEQAHSYSATKRPPPVYHLGAEKGPHHHKSYHLRHHDPSFAIGRQRGSVATARNARWQNEGDPRYAASLKWKERPVNQHDHGKAHRAPETEDKIDLDNDAELGKHMPSVGVHPTPQLSRRPSPRHHRLSIRANPFSIRSGKKLTWTNVTMELVNGDAKEGCQKICPCVDNTKDSKNESDATRDGKLILDNCWGEVPEKEITAILGPSGSGKTSLLNILAGRAKTRGKLKVSADVRLNNYSVDPTKQAVRKQIAFVPQDDSLQITATPREAIRFSAKMRLSAKTSEAELDDLTSVMLSELGLKECQHTIIGGALIKGISGGERKRTAVGVELVTKPALIFLDEPTSGLDAFSAVQLIKVLKKVAAAGSSVLTTIHQPSSEVFNAFHHIILLNKGRVMYEGEVRDVPTFFEARGHPVPPHYNPADWIMNVAQAVPAKELVRRGYFPSDTRPWTQTEALFVDEEEGRNALGITDHQHNGEGMSAKGNEKRIGFVTQISMLFKRELQNIARNRKPLVARFAFSFIMSILVGILFLGIGGEGSEDFRVVQAHFGALVLVLMMSMFGTAMPSLLAFPEERPVFLREYSTDHYSVGAYFVSRLTTEAIVTFPQMLLSTTLTYLLIDLQMAFGYLLAVVYTLAMTSTAVAVLLGCSVEDPKMASEFLPLLFVPQLLFAGFFVASELIPEWLRWAQYLCSLTYALRLALLAEFGPCADEEDLSSSGQPNHCRAILENSGAEEDQEWLYWLILCCLFLAFRLSALLILRKKAKKFF